MAATPHPLNGVTVLERGWLSSNNILIHAAPGEPGAVLVDTGHVNHAAQTVALVRQALAGQPLARIVNTHLHSDHCGGNAALQQALGAPVWLPPGEAAAVAAWNDSAPDDAVEGALSWHATGQRCARFTVSGTYAAGDVLRAGGRSWQVLAAPGHDPHSVMLYDAEHGVLLSADALWEHGFGVVFPEIVGEPGFDDVGAVLDLIAGLPVRLVVPGHGAPFSDVASALARARSRLAGFQADPLRHARHAIKVLIKYHLMEERTQPLAGLRAWAVATPIFKDLWRQLNDAGPAGAARSPGDWCDALVADLVAGGALALADGVVSDA